MGGEGEEGRGGLFATLAVLPCSRAHLIHRLNHVLGGGKMLVIKRIRRSRAEPNFDFQIDELNTPNFTSMFEDRRTLQRLVRR